MIYELVFTGPNLATENREMKSVREVVCEIELLLGRGYTKFHLSTEPDVTACAICSAEVYDNHSLCKTCEKEFLETP